MPKKRRQTANRAILACLLLIGGLASSCARYAPQAVVAPKRKILEIILITKATVDPAAYYYIAMDTSNDPDTDGPHTILSGLESGKNWNYYIRLHNNVFTERYITTLAEMDNEPTFFDQSDRFYFAVASGTAITVRLYLDKLFTGNKKIWFNFITSAAPITGTNVNVPAIDFLNTPSFYANTQYETTITHATYPAISEHAAPAGLEAADIVAWSVKIYNI